MGKFDSICWACSVSNNSPETQDESAANELTQAMSGGLDGSADDDNNVTSKDRWLSAPNISNIGHKWEGCDLA